MKKIKTCKIFLIKMKHFTTHPSDGLDQRTGSGRTHAVCSRQPTATDTGTTWQRCQPWPMVGRAGHGFPSSARRMNQPLWDFHYQKKKLKTFLWLKLKNVKFHKDL